ncbi:MAG: hypothetical protein PHR75_01010 [Sulfurovum sp.]|nr:hypothetical protein [Sulfurovum sp.]MDD3601739.1 hypothetical protein [Sulfurovum sp.]
MKIEFEKVGTTPKPFKVEFEGAKLEGNLYKSGYHRVVLEGKLSGNIKLDCDRCGSPFDYPLENFLKLTISDQPVEDKDDLDIIEFLDGRIDLSYILESEINALRGSYHYCAKCSNSDEMFEAEF